MRFRASEIVGPRGSVAVTALTWVLRAVAFALLCVACGRSAAPPEGAHGRPGQPASRVRSLVDPARPTLRLVHREGDPRGVLAVAVFTTGGSRGAHLLGHLVRHRLRAAGSWTPELAVHGIGFVLASEVQSPKDGAALLNALHAALVSEVEPGEVAAAGLRAELRRALSPLIGPSLVGLCGAEFGAEGGSALGLDQAPTTAELERIRSTSVRSGRIGLSALGEPSLLDRVAQAHDAKWPKGDGPADPWPHEDQIAVRQSGGVFELRVAARVVDQARALAAGRALEDEDHPAWMRLRALDPLLEPGPISVALRPAGACVALTVLRTDSAPPSAETLAAATWIAEHELLGALRDGALQDPSGWVASAPESALDAASLAAWTVVSVSAPASPPTTLIELVAPIGLDLKTESFSEQLERTHAAFEKRQIPLVSRTESGQPESWLLLASPCGTGPEPTHEAGLRALALRAAARAFDEPRGVRIEPWIEARALGILVHAAPLEDESPEQLAERLARAAARALTLGSVDGTTIASARSEQLLELGSDPGRDFLVRALSGDQPSTLDPRGLEREVAALSTFDVERARLTLGREPLRAAYLASARGAEAAAARSELSRLLAPGRSDVLACPKAGAVTASPGAWSITSVDAEVDTGAFVGIPVQTSSPSGYALEFLLNREGGYLEHALVSSGLADSARASFMPGAFGSALLIELKADAPKLDGAIAQARGVLASLTKGLPSRDAKRARDEEALQRAEARRSPRGRLVELWLGRLPPPPVEADLRALTDQVGPAEHRVVKVQVRPEVRAE